MQEDWEERGRELKKGGDVDFPSPRDQKFCVRFHI